MAKTLATSTLLFLSALVAIASSAAIPVRWTTDAYKVKPLVYECYHGETLDMAAALTAYGEPIDFGGKTAKLYWQTNGMASAWWSTNAFVRAEAGATNILAAIWSGAYDTGSANVAGFIGVEGENYRAAFELVFRSSPGFIPNALPIPPKSIDWANVANANVDSAPFVVKGGAGGLTPEQAAAISDNRITNAVTSGYLAKEHDNVGNQVIRGTQTPLGSWSITVSSANYADAAGFASSANAAEHANTASSAGSAESAGKANEDQFGRNIYNTYATKQELGAATNEIRGTLTNYYTKTETDAKLYGDSIPYSHESPEGITINSQIEYARSVADSAYTKAEGASSQATLALSELALHAQNTGNPHQVTAAQVGAVTATEATNIAENVSAPIATNAAEAVVGEVMEYGLTNLTANTETFALASGVIGNLALDSAHTNINLTLVYPTATDKSADILLRVVNAADTTLAINSVDTDVDGTEWTAVKAGTNYVTATRTAYEGGRSKVIVNVKEVK